MQKKVTRRQFLKYMLSGAALVALDQVGVATYSEGLVMDHAGSTLDTLSARSEILSDTELSALYASSAIDLGQNEDFWVHSGVLADFSRGWQLYSNAKPSFALSETLYACKAFDISPRYVVPMMAYWGRVKIGSPFRMFRERVVATMQTEISTHSRFIPGLMDFAVSVLGVPRRADLECRTTGFWDKGADTLAKAIKASVDSGPFTYHSWASLAGLEDYQMQSLIEGAVNNHNLKIEEMQRTGNKKTRFDESLRLSNLALEKEMVRLQGSPSWEIGTTVALIAQQRKESLAIWNSSGIGTGYEDPTFSPLMLYMLLIGSDWYKEQRTRPFDTRLESEPAAPEFVIPSALEFAESVIPGITQRSLVPMNLQEEITVIKGMEAQYSNPLTSEYALDAIKLANASIPQNI